MNIEDIRKIIESDKIDPTTAINILISAVSSSFDEGHFNDLDKALISKALDCLDQQFMTGEDFIVKVYPPSNSS